MKKPALIVVALAAAVLGGILYFRREPELPAPPGRPAAPRVERVGDRAWKVPKPLREAYFSDPARVNQDVQLKPLPGAGPDDVAELRIEFLREGSPLQEAGFRTGDNILEVNGAPVKTMGRALNLLNEIRTSDRVTVKTERAGMTKEYRVDFE